ncbi:MAG: hypothetical protein O2999_06010 [Nitrospirae bacterium]|nr:hypothetical protein [Nitrospirota bacterium]MDA1303840.1 hypothetical protein [Nitrospirota bacterium]
MVGFLLLSYNRRNKHLARTLRKTMTDAELMLGSRLRRKQIQNGNVEKSRQRRSLALPKRFAQT